MRNLGTAMLRKRLPLLAVLLFLAPSARAQVVEYYHLDAVGNVRVVTNQAGQVVERHDYLPFGEECLTGPCLANPGVGAGQPRKFTGKERDAETGLDYFGARYYGSRIGRFTTVDPVYTWDENLVDPQRWNRYAYARNNPLRYTDPDGKIIFDYAQFKQNLSLIGAPGVGADIRALAVLATAGSVANDVLLAVGVGGVLQGIRGGLAATSVARTGLGLTDDAGRLIVSPQTQLAQGASPALVVPDAYTVVRGGQGAVPPPGTAFSGSAGPQQLTPPQVCRMGLFGRRRPAPSVSRAGVLF